MHGLHGQVVKASSLSVGDTGSNPSPMIPVTFILARQLTALPGGRCQRKKWSLGASIE